MSDNMSQIDLFNKKLAVLCETPTLLTEIDFEHLRLIKESKDELDKMSNVYYYIKSEDLLKITKNMDKKIYLRLSIDSPRKYKNTEFVLDQKRIINFSPRKYNHDSMSVSDSPGRENFNNTILENEHSDNALTREHSNGTRASTSSDTSSHIQSKKSKRLSKRSTNSDHSRQEVLIDSIKYIIYFIKTEIKYSVFICRKEKDNDVITCSAAQDEDIKGSRVSKLLKYESVELNLNNADITIHSPNLTILTFPMYFVFENSMMTIEKFISIIEYIIVSVLFKNKK